MNKIAYYALVLLMGVLPNANADTNFRWNSGTGTLKNSSNTNIAIGNATVLTFLSNDVIIDALGFVSGGNLDLRDTYGNDVFFKSEANITIPGRLITAYMPNSGDSLVGKYAYTIVLDMPFSTFVGTYGGLIANVPKNGTVMAGISTMSASSLIKVDTEPPTTPQDFVSAVQTNLRVIPEPAGVGLIALGAGILAIRRYRARRG